MLVVCSATDKSSAFKFNGNKSHCLSLGKLANVDIGHMLFDNQSADWCYSIKYLGVHLLSGKGLSFGIAPIKRTFYAACNILFSHSRGVDKIIQLSLQETYCLPVLLYASPALYLKTNQLSKLEVCWNSIYHKILNFSLKESVRLFIFGL